MKFVSRKRNAHVRRNGWSQRKPRPSASRERSEERSGSRSCWNGVRIASSARLGCREHGGAAALDERDECNRPESGPVEQDRGREGCDGEYACDVGGDHHPLAAPAIGRQPGRQGEERLRKRSCEGDDAGLRRRSREREHEERIRDHGRPGAGVR